MHYLMSFLFVAVSSVNLYTQGENTPAQVMARRVSKGLLMPVLALAYSQWMAFYAGASPNVLILVALAMSWIGDLWLLGRRTPDASGVRVAIELPDSMFMLGLIFFFLGHVAYSAAFLSAAQLETIPTYMYAFLLFIFWYGIILYKGVAPTGAIKIGTVFYMIAIGMMIFLAMDGFRVHLDMPSFMVLLGAILFGSSDSVLAFQCIKKVTKLPASYVMFSYISGQFFIVLGFFMRAL
ncbi:lysoplasmalogenase family protein [Fusibacter sp. JL298sf-3]